VIRLHALVFQPYAIVTYLQAAVRDRPQLAQTVEKRSANLALASRCRANSGLDYPKWHIETAGKDE
jgi:hypothetical protein